MLLYSPQPLAAAAVAEAVVVAMPWAMVVLVLLLLHEVVPMGVAMAESVDRRWLWL